MCHDRGIPDGRHGSELRELVHLPAPGPAPQTAVNFVNLFIFDVGAGTTIEPGDTGVQKSTGACNRATTQHVSAAMIASRRTFAAALAALPLAVALGPRALAASGRFEVSYPDAEWRRRLDPAAYDVLRRDGTERPFTSPLNAEHRAGTFACKGCALPLFAAKAKFDSGTGWPSFYAPLANAVATTTDRTLLMARTEVHCRRCGGHLGHVFDDGPRPTGLRYCMNGVALTFSPVKA